MNWLDGFFRLSELKLGSLVIMYIVCCKFVVDTSHFFPGPAVIFLSLAMFSRSMPITFYLFDWQFKQASNAQP